jgi:pyruvate/oxaloacetate carboxyltransferase
LNKNVGSDNASNYVILIDREFDIIAKKKEGSSVVDGKVGKIRVQIKDNYVKNLLENQLKGLEASEDDKLSSFALNEIKTKMDLNAKFSSNIYKE